MNDLIPKKLFPTDFWSTFDKQFDDFMDVFSMNKGEYSHRDNDGNLILQLEVPGFNKDNLKVEVRNGVLRVNGERSVSQEEPQFKKTINREYSVGSVDDIDAEIKDGILIIKVIPHRRVERRQIEIK